MKVRNKTNTWTGITNSFNTHGLGEVIVGFDDESGMDSIFISELEVFVPSLNEWKDMKKAFEDKDLIPDNYNTIFAEPKNELERQRGYF